MDPPLGSIHFFFLSSLGIYPPPQLQSPGLNISNTRGQMHVGGANTMDQNAGRIQKGGRASMNQWSAEHHT